jgi:hypothetical protein
MDHLFLLLQEHDKAASSLALPFRSGNKNSDLAVCQGGIRILLLSAWATKIAT